MQLTYGKEVVLVISDTQYPFHHPDTFKFLRAIKKKYKPSKVVHIGDSVDFNCFSDYARDPEALSTTQEYNKALEALHEQYALFPEGVEVYSNHVARLDRRFQGAGVLPCMRKPMDEILEMPEGWSMVNSVIIEGVKYEHGDRGGGQNAAKDLAIANRKSTVIGHHHSTGAVHYIANEEEMIFGVNAGCMIDMSSYAFKYAKRGKTRPTLGTVVVNKGVPHFIPMLTTKDNRWAGRIY